MTKIISATLCFCFIALTSFAFGDDRIPIPIQSASATGILDPYEAENVFDGVTSNDSRWVSENTTSQHRLTIELAAPETIEFVKIAMGWQNSNGVWGSPIENFRLEMFAGGNWVAIPGASVAGNTRAVVTLRPDSPVTTSRIRLVSDDNGYVRVAEIYLFRDEPGTLPIVDIDRPEILVNQSGYDMDRPKRFTLPGISDAAAFEVVRVDDDSVVFSGTALDGVGDFSGFIPLDSGDEFYIRIDELRSDNFLIEPYWMERVCLEPAFRFFVDSRSVIGDVPTAYGADPWRDSPYYCFDVQSLILNYLANPSYYESLPIEIDYDAQKAMVTASGFELVSTQNVEDAVEIARAYYNTVDPPVGTDVPDMVQLLHWGYAYLRLKPGDWDYAGDPAGRQLHPQHVEKFAFFLYAFPQYQQYFTQQYYDDALNFALTNWDGPGGNLYDVITTDILANDVVKSTFKGRNCPGHSILPNLMMYEVALRDGLPNPEAFFDAAYAQTEYIIDNFPASTERLTKGQRMSEHMLPTGLFAFNRMYPDRAPAGLQQWIDDWVTVMISRSDNRYDFRKFGFYEGSELWTIPRFGDESNNGGSGWNEPGNVAGVPGVMIAMGSQASDQSQRLRLNEIEVAHWDALFGRNPTGWHSAFNGPTDFVGVERGWQRDFNPNAAARLHGVRGTLNSCATNEHYPNDLSAGNLRHPEGWTAFNSAFSVSLAFQCWDRNEVEMSLSETEADFVLSGPVLAPSADIQVESTIGDREVVTVGSTNDLNTRFVGSIPVSNEGPVVPGDGVLNTGGTTTASYGTGFFSKSARSDLFLDLPIADFDVTKGQVGGGGLNELRESDNLDLSVRRDPSGIQAHVFVEFQATSPTTTVQSLQFTFESSVFARTNVVQYIEVFNNETNGFEVVDQRNASRFVDSTTTIELDGDLTRFIDPATKWIVARVRFEGDSPRLAFSANIDQARWVILP